jgi:hypothetical protein
MKCICHPSLKFIKRTCFQWKHNRFNLTPYKVAQCGHKRQTRWPSNWFSSTNPLVCEEVIQWPSHIRRTLAGCSVLLKEGSERFDSRIAGLREPYKITRWHLPLTVASLKEKILIPCDLLRTQQICNLGESLSCSHNNWPFFLPKGGRWLGHWCGKLHHQKTSAFQETLVTG